MTAPRCLDCEHFYVTWNPHFPRGCRAYGVVSRQMPGHVVIDATGQRCAAFERSARLKDGASARGRGT